MSDRWIKCLSTSGTVRGVAVSAGNVVAELCKLHKLSGEDAKRFSEALVSGFLLGSFCKIGERMNLSIQPRGSIKQVLVDAYPEGHVRGYFSGTSDVVSSTDGVEPLFGPWGPGLLTVLRTKEHEEFRPYSGTVPLVTGHLAKDLTFYWVQSEQIPSAVGISVQMDASNQLPVSAGGFIIQALPGATVVEINQIENEISNLDDLAKSFSEDQGPVVLLGTLFHNLSFHILEEKALSWSCSCSRERVEKALRLIGNQELQQLLNEDKKIEVHCDFCTKDYVFREEILNPTS